MKAIKIGIVMFSFLFLIVIIGCTKARGSATELRVAEPAQPPTLDPHMTVSTVALDISRHVFETLVTVNNEYQAVPMLAASVEISEDGKTYIFNLREGVTFHNGEEMTAEDVVASMSRWLEQSARAKRLGDASFVEQDAYTVVMNLPERSFEALDILAAPSQFPAIMPKDVIASAEKKGVTDYIGTGPFKLVEWKQDQYIHLEKYENYAEVEEETSGLAGKKRALVDNIYFDIVTDPSTRLSGIQTGKYDIADVMPPENYEQLKEMPNIETYNVASGTLTLFYNINKGVLADPKIRQAVNTALNMDEIMLASFVNEDLYLLDPGYMNVDQTNWASQAGKEAYNQADMETAKKMLAEAGYNGEEITILTTRDYNEMYTACVVIQEQLSQLGLNVTLENYDFATFLERKGDPDNWDLFTATTGYVPTPSQLLAVTPDWSGVNDPKISDLLEAIKLAKAEDEAKSMWDELQAYLYDLLPSTVVGHNNRTIVTTDNVEGFTFLRAPILWNTKVAK